MVDERYLTLYCALKNASESFARLAQTLEDGNSLDSGQELGVLNTTAKVALSLAKMKQKEFMEEGMR